MVPEHIRALARKYLDLPGTDPGDTLYAQLKEECAREGISPREAFEAAIPRSSPSPLPVPANAHGTLTFEVAMVWESPEGSWVELLVPGSPDRFKITTDFDTFTRVVKPAIKSG
jgi:hypothetical protein